jgi:tetratricopeptide (TPR) repeat protein
MISGLMVTTADRFLYVPVFFFGVAIALILPEKLRIPKVLQIASAVASLLVVLSWAVIDMRRADDFESEESFWRHEQSIDPENPAALAALGRVELRKGKIEEAFVLLKNAGLGGGHHFALLSPEHELFAVYTDLLSIQGYRIADGDLASLRLLKGELSAFVEGKAGPARGKARDLLVGQNWSPNSVGDIHRQKKDLYRIESAAIAVRLGEDDAARKILSETSDVQEYEVTRSFNLALTYARLGEWPRAWKILDGVKSSSVGENEEALAEVRSRLKAAERLDHEAAEHQGQEAIVIAAQAQAELGAYGRAIRLLRGIALEQESGEGIAPLYVQLLVAARLEDEALSVAGKWLKADEAERVVSSIRLQLPKGVRAIPKVSARANW